MFKQITNLLTYINNTYIDDNSDELIANRYKLKHLIGKGAMGEVYCASDQNLGGVNVAIKFLAQTLLDEKRRARFKQEAQLSALLGEKSIYIVKVKDYGLDKHNVPFYVMQLLEGSSLDKMIISKVISLRKFLSIIRQVCLGLECAHKGIMINGELSRIIHRDIKPSNIFIVQDSALGDMVKILDFGIAQVNNPSQSTSPSFMGTPRYCSPEQLAEEKLDPRSDIYSLGVMMYVMLAGKMPLTAKENTFEGWCYAHQKTQPEPLPRYLNLPSNLEKMIMSCLAKSPDHRPQNVGTIIQLINSLEQEYPSLSLKNVHISAKSRNVDVPQSKKSKSYLPIQEKYRQSSWPDDKPQQKIVFPKLTTSKEGVFASLWTMLENKDLIQFNPSSTFCYNHFLFQLSPHPMILWINLLYCRRHEPKWLPCYLDLTTKLGKQVVGNLVERKLYHILLFALNRPERYKQLIPMEISKDKAKKISVCWQKSIPWQGKKQPEATKKALKQEFELVKVKILELIKRVNSK